LSFVISIVSLSSVAGASGPEQMPPPGYAEPYEPGDAPRYAPGYAPPAEDRPARREYSGACRDSDDPRDVCEARDIYLMPGVSSVLFAPAAAGNKPYVGGGVQLTPIRWSHNNDHFGPSQGAVFFQASLLRSLSSERTLALYDAGYTLSFERNSSRQFLIPYFGGTLGALSHAELGDSAYTYQFAGAHLVWHQNLVVSAEGGYQFPFSDVDVVRGPRASFSAGFSMW
jgi:hypothetical protein